MPRPPLKNRFPSLLAHAASGGAPNRRSRRCAQRPIEARRGHLENTPSHDILDVQDRAETGSPGAVSTLTLRRSLRRAGTVPSAAQPSARFAPYFPRTLRAVCRWPPGPPRAHCSSTRLAGHVFETQRKSGHSAHSSYKPGANPKLRATFRPNEYRRRRGRVFRPE